MNAPVDFVIVTALEEERDAVLRKLPGWQLLPATTDDIHRYYACDLPTTNAAGKRGTYKVVIVLLLNMGRVEAATATADAIKLWRPAYVLLVGIAGGIASAGVHLGDVIVADQIVDYELQKLTDGGKNIRYSVHRADPALLSAAQNYSNTSWLHSVTVARPDPGEPTRRIAPIATGDKVIAVDDVLTEYQVAWPKLIGVEMEAGGVASACFQSATAPGFFMIRAVSDLANAAKNSSAVGQWRPYACDVAASYAVSFLQSAPVVIRRSRAAAKVAFLSTLLLTATSLSWLQLSRHYAESPVQRPRITASPEWCTATGSIKKAIPRGAEFALFIEDAPVGSTITWSQPHCGTITPQSGNGVEYVATKYGQESLTALVRSTRSQFHVETSFLVVRITRGTSN